MTDSVCVVLLYKIIQNLQWNTKTETNIRIIVRMSTVPIFTIIKHLSKYIYKLYYNINIYNYILNY